MTKMLVEEPREGVKLSVDKNQLGFKHSLPAFSMYCADPPYCLVPTFPRPCEPWYKPTLREPELFRTTTPDKAIGLPEEPTDGLKAFMNNRGVDGLGDFEKYTRDLDSLEHAAEFARRHVNEKDRWIYKLLPEISSSQADVQVAKDLLAAGWRELTSGWHKAGTYEFNRPRLLTGDDLFLWHKFKRPVIVPDSEDILLRGQLRDSKKQVTIRLIKNDKGDVLHPLTEELHIRNLLREMAIQTLVHARTGTCPQVIGLVPVCDEARNFIRLAMVQEFVPCIPGKSFQITMLDAWKLNVELKQKGKMLLKESQWVRLIQRLAETARTLSKHQVLHYDMRMQNVLLKYQDGELFPVLNHWGRALFRNNKISDIHVHATVITGKEWFDKYVAGAAFTENMCYGQSDLYTLSDIVSCMAEFFDWKTSLFHLRNEMRRKMDMRMLFPYIMSKLRAS